jgi:hypothetical protein
MKALYKFIIEKIENNDGYKGNTSITFFNNYMKRSDNKKHFSFIEFKYYTFKRILFTRYNEFDKVFCEYFFKLQKIMNGFFQLKLLVNKKKKKIKKDFVDLNFDSLENEKVQNIIELEEGNTIYYFKLTDLINIINNNLCYNENMFPVSKNIKNPYTNINFSKSSLYNIYFKIKDSTFNMPILFERFFQVNFNLNLFKKHNDILLKEYLVKNFMTNSTDNTKIKYIKKMIQNFNYKNKNKINYDKDFPSSELLIVFKKFLKSYINTYYINLESKYYYKHEFYKGLFEFVNCNPYFGRKIITKGIKEVLKLSLNKEKFPTFSSEYYIPPRRLINIKKKSFFVSEIDQQFSLFTLQITNYNQKLKLPIRVPENQYMSDIIPANIKEFKPIFEPSIYEKYNLKSNKNSRYIRYLADTDFFLDDDSDSESDSEPIINVHNHVRENNSVENNQEENNTMEEDNTEDLLPSINSVSIIDPSYMTLEIRGNRIITSENHDITEDLLNNIFPFNSNDSLHDISVVEHAEEFIHNFNSSETSDSDDEI